MANEFPQQFQNLLARLAAGDQAAQDAMGDLISSIFVPRYVTVAGTTLTLTEEHRGARIIFTSGSAVTVTVPDTLEAGFMASFVFLGAGTVTFTGADLGGTTSGGQNKAAMLERLPTGDWFLSGGVA